MVESEEKTRGLKWLIHSINIFAERTGCTWQRAGPGLKSARGRRNMRRAHVFKKWFPACSAQHCRRRWENSSNKTGKAPFPSQSLYSKDFLWDQRKGLSSPYPPSSHNLRGKTKDRHWVEISKWCQKTRLLNEECISVVGNERKHSKGMTQGCLCQRLARTPQGGHWNACFPELRAPGDSSPADVCLWDPS